MVEAPEKIWAARGLYDTVSDVRSPAPVEYTRSDIAERQIAELRAEADAMRAKAISNAQERNAAEAREARLSEALEPFAEAGKAMLLTGGENPKLSGPRMAEHLERARAALSGSR